MGELRKNKTVTVVRAAVPPQSALPPVDMQLYGVPTPYGSAYRYRTADRTETVMFEGDSMYVPPGASIIYEQRGSGTVADPYVQVPVGYYRVVSGKLLIDEPSDFATWSQIDSSAPPGWHGLPGLMLPIHFDGVPLKPNGYPEPGHDGPIEGWFEVPTASGRHRETRRYYRRDASRLWRPEGYTDPPYCTTRGTVTMLAGFPGRDDTDGRPPVIDTDYNIGWNAGANSLQRLDGNVRTTFSVDVEVAMAVGLANSRPDVGNYRNLTHAFYFDPDPATGRTRVSAMERGQRVTAPRLHAAAAVYVIERIDGVVSYQIDGAEVHRSTLRSSGEVMVGCALYHADGRVQ